jgi:hypothetical protein
MGSKERRWYRYCICIYLQIYGYKYLFVYSIFMIICLCIYIFIHIYIYIFPESTVRSKPRAPQATSPFLVLGVFDSYPTILRYLHVYIHEYTCSCVNLFYSFVSDFEWNPITLRNVYEHICIWIRIEGC